MSYFPQKDHDIWDFRTTLPSRSTRTTGNHHRLKYNSSQTMLPDHPPHHVSIPLARHAHRSTIHPTASHQQQSAQSHHPKRHQTPIHNNEVFQSSHHISQTWPTSSPMTLSDEDILKLYNIPSITHLMQVHGLSAQNKIHVEHLHAIIQGMRSDAVGRWEQARLEEAHLQRPAIESEDVKIPGHSMDRPLTSSPGKRRIATVEDVNEPVDGHGANRARSAAVMNEQRVARVYDEMMSAGETMRRANVVSQQNMLAMMRDKQEREVEWAEWEEMMKCREVEEAERGEVEGRKRKGGRKQRV